MKRLIPFLLCLLLLSGCKKNNGPLDRVSELLCTDASEFSVITYYDSHGGFHGDGETVIIMQLTQQQAIRLDQDTQNHFCRREIPFSEPVSITLYGGDVMRGGVAWYHNALFQNESGASLVPEISNGFYLFYDRHRESTDPSDDAHLHTRGSRNFDLAIFDADTNTLYYLVLDT